MVDCISPSQKIVDFLLPVWLQLTLSLSLPLPIAISDFEAEGEQVAQLIPPQALAKILYPSDSAIVTFQISAFARTVTQRYSEVSSLDSYFHIRWGLMQLSFANPR